MAIRRMADVALPLGRLDLGSTLRLEERPARSTYGWRLERIGRMGPVDAPILRRRQRSRGFRQRGYLSRRSPVAWMQSRAPVLIEGQVGTGLGGRSGPVGRGASNGVPPEPGPVRPPPLVVLTGHEARDPVGVSAYLDAGAVLVIASTADAVRAWLPGALSGTERRETPHVVVRVGHLEVDLTEQRARWLDRRLDLSSHELRLLAALGGDGRVWTFEEIADRVWGSTYGDRSVIHSAVKRLRKKLARAGVDVRIEAIRGVGLLLTSERSSHKTVVDNGSL